MTISLLEDPWAAQYFRSLFSGWTSVDPETADGEEKSLGKVKGLLFLHSMDTATSLCLSNGKFLKKVCSNLFK